MASAQETFRTMLRDRIAPAVRSLGLKGSGQVYTLPSETHWALLGFQKSQFSDATRIRFTINLTVASKGEWEDARTAKPYLPARPSPNTFYGTFLSQSRIGTLLPGGEDQWWEVRAGASNDRVTEEVLAAIRDHALPAMRSQMTDAPTNS